MIRWFIVAAIGAIALIVGIAVDPAQAYYSYLTAYIYGVGIVVCALILLMIEQVVGASWFVVLRRRAETIASALPIFVPLFLPIAFGAGHLYPWTHAASLPARERDLVTHTLSYLNLPFFLIRSAIYLGCWVLLNEQIRRWSLAQDTAGGAAWTARINRLSAPGLIVLGFTLAFAAIDWVMSLAPGWFSTIFGVQLFAGAMLGTLALMSLDTGAADLPVTPEHSSALGKMIFTFACFWAYTTFSQLLIIWIADIPQEVTWYVPRASGSWLVVGLALGAAEWAVPFGCLLSYRLKRSRQFLARLGWWLLCAHYVEMYWVVMPQLHPAGARPHWLDAAAAATVIGAAAGCAIWRARGHADVPIGDPELDLSLRYSES